MLALTDRAVGIIKQAVEANQLPNGAGVRITASTPPAEQSAYSVGLAEAPQLEDEVVDVDGARVFLDEAASSRLDDKVLDAEIDPGGGVTFGLSEKAA